MSTTNQLPEPELGYIKTDKSNQPAFSARQMREMKDTNQLPPSEREAFEAFAQNCPMGKYSIARRGDGYDSSHTQLMWDAWQARAQVQGEPVAWMHWLNGPVRVFMNKDVAMMELDRLNREYPLDTDDRKMRPLLFGDTAPQPTQATQAASAEDMKVYDSIADRYFRVATQTEVTEGIRPEDFTVDVVVKPMGGFAPVNTQGVRVTHKPTGISVTCDAARSQHTNRNQAFETLRSILSQQPEPMAWTCTDDRLPKAETPVLILHAGKVRIGELCWDYPGYEDTYQAYRYWDDPEDDGQVWEWNDVTHWTPLPALPESPCHGITAQAKKGGA